MAPLARAYAILHVKKIDAAARRISGIASTPTPDRHGDVIEPLGLSFNNPLPLLLHHDPERPVGRVMLSPPTRDGIAFEATLPVVSEPGIVRDRVDEAWHSIEAGLLPGISIGLRPRDTKSIERIPGGRFHWRTSEVCELSLVTIPANREATILTVKALDAPHLAATGLYPSGDPDLPVVSMHNRGGPMTIQEQITQFENTRALKVTKQTELMTKAAETGITLDQAQGEEYDGLGGEIRSIDTHVARLRDQEAIAKAAATRIPASAVVTTKAADVVRDGGNPVIQVKSMLPKGTAFVRYAMALAAGKGSRADAIAIAQQWKDSTPEVELMLKAAIAPGTTTDAVWAKPLVPAFQTLTDEFVELLRPATIIGRIEGLRKVPFNTQVPRQTAGGVYNWVGETKPKPLTKLAFDLVAIGMSKIAGIIVMSEELARLSSPSAEAAARADMIAGISAFMDQQFIDPAVAPVASVHPGSITNGTVAIPSGGTDMQKATADLMALVASFVGAGIPLTKAVFLMSESNAFALGSARTALNAPVFSLTASGGNVNGIPVIASSAVGSNVVLINPPDILIADEGGVTIDISREASLQMSDTPDDPVAATTVYLNLWQNNLVGLRAERFCSWLRGRDAAVKYISGAAYTGQFAVASPSGAPPEGRRAA